MTAASGGWPELTNRSVGSFWVHTEASTYLLDLATGRPSQIFRMPGDGPGSLPYWTPTNAAELAGDNDGSLRLISIERCRAGEPAVFLILDPATTPLTQGDGGVLRRTTTTVLAIASVDERADEATNPATGADIATGAGQAGRDLGETADVPVILDRALGDGEQVSTDVDIVDFSDVVEVSDLRVELIHEPAEGSSQCYVYARELTAEVWEDSVEVAEVIAAHQVAHELSTPLAQIEFDIRRRNPDGTTYWIRGWRCAVADDSGWDTHEARELRILRDRAIYECHRHVDPSVIEVLCVEASTGLDADLEVHYSVPAWGMSGTLLRTEALARLSELADLIGQHGPADGKPPEVRRVWPQMLLTKTFIDTTTGLDAVDGSRWDGTTVSARQASEVLDQMIAWWHIRHDFRVTG